MKIWKANVAVAFALIINLVVNSQVKGSYVHQEIDCSFSNTPSCSNTSEVCLTYCTTLGYNNGSCDLQGDCCFCLPALSPEIEENSVENSSLITTNNNSIDIVENITSINEECQSNDDVCLTPGCVKSAAYLLNKMNPSVDPCDNFFEFACGEFTENALIPDDDFAVDPFTLLAEKLYSKIRVLVETPATSDEAKPFRLVKHLYKSCINITAIESHGLETLKDVLNKLGGWPVLHQNQSWNPEKWDWLSSIYKFHKVGYPNDYLLSVSVQVDLENNTRNVLTIGEPTLKITKETFMLEPFVRAYHKYQIYLVVFLGAHPNTAKNDMKNVLEFERQLADISLSLDQKRNTTKFYNPTTLTVLQEDFPSVPWLEYLEQILPPTVKITHDERINLVSPSHLTSLLKLLEATDKRAAVNSVDYLNEEARALQFQFERSVSGFRQMAPRWKQCINTVTSRLPHAIDAMYVRRHFKGDARNDAVEMFEDIRQAFLETLNDTNWMDNTTRSLAWDKASAISALIGFPQELLDDQKLSDVYKDVDFKSIDYLENFLTLAVAKGKYKMEKLREVNNKSDWRSYMNVAEVNAYYLRNINSVQLSAGILQENFYDLSRPKFLNYGAMGWVIGHEITHGFDDKGRLFDAEGNLKEWWDPFTKESYVNKTRCIIKQYGEYKYNDPIQNKSIPLNGVISQGENIADNGGIRQAYKGYQSWVSRNGPEKKLPGLPFSPNQLFWIGAANIYCDKIRPEAMLQIILTSPHMSGEFRIRGSFSNMHQFAKDFNCPYQSNMNPANKCIVW